MVSTARAGGVVDLGCSLHFTKSFKSDYWRMELSGEEMAKLQAELQTLREENKQLKRLIREMKDRQDQGQFELVRSTHYPPRPRAQVDATVCSYCPHCKPVPEKSRKQLVQEFQMWSHRLNNSFPMKKHLSEIHSSEEEPYQEMPDIPELSHRTDPLIENICLFGPNIQQMRAADKHQRVSHQLYFPARQAGLQAYGNYLYPQRVGFKVVRQKKKDVDIDKILFRKSFKQQDCSIFIFFQCNGEGEESKNQVARNINPFKTLYNIGLQFNDYLFSDQPYRHGIDRSLSISEDRIQELHAQEDVVVPEDLTSKASSNSTNANNVYGDTCVFKSNYYLCIFSHFPFVDFFCQLLIRIIDQIKIKRMERHSEKGKKYSELDILYVAKQLDRIIKEITPLLDKFQVHEGARLTLNFGTQNLSLNLEGSNLMESLVWEWAYRALRIFDKDTLFQIYCLVMLEQTVCIICENPYMLTFAIHLLVSVLPRPFHYPYPIVSIVFEQEFLETPFTTMLGINKGSKWLQANEAVFMEKMEGKIVVNLNDDQVKIKSKRKYKLPKSEKLKKIFASFYKKAERFDGSSKRRQIFNREVSRAQNELSMQLLADLQGFYRQQLLSYMPNKEIIDSIRSSIPGDNQTTVSTRLIKNIEQYIKQSRKSKEHDAMVDVLMQKQIFYVYLTQKYEIA